MYVFKRSIMWFKVSISRKDNWLSKADINSETLLCNAYPHKDTQNYHFYVRTLIFRFLQFLDESSKMLIIKEIFQNLMITKRKNEIK